MTINVFLIAHNPLFRILAVVNKDIFANITDAELLEKFYETRDNKWLGILLPRYSLLLLGVCMKYLKNEDDAKDSVQQIFLKAITELHKYRVEYVKSWLYMIAKNHCLMQLRNQQDKMSISLQDTMPVIHEEMNVHALKEREIMFQEIESALPLLNKEQQCCIDLFYLQKQSYQQISENTGYSLLQIKSYIQNGKRNLKNLVEKKIKDIYNGA